MAPPFTRSSVRAAALSASLLLSCSVTVLAAGMASPQPVRDASTSEQDVLKALPASHDELVFRGENGSATWPVYFSRGEAARTDVFQLGLLNTVSLLPERSNLRLSINGHTLTTMQIRSPDKVSNISIRIPPGVLVPGFNAVELHVTMAHRVDCSVKAAYELWTLLDPAQTGFLVPAQAATAPRTLDDLAAERPADDGTTRIHLRVPADPSAELLSRGANVISALVARSHLLRPVVDVGSDPGQGPGFDVVLGDDPGREAGAVRQDGFVMRRDATSHRIVIAAPDGDGDALQAAGAGKAEPLGTRQGLRAFEMLSGHTIDGDRRLSFGELGQRDTVIAGRRYTKDLGVTMPDDFYPGNYGKALIYLDGSRAVGLSASASLYFRVNGALVSTLPLGPASPDRFDHAMVELPLKFFRPGYNAVQIEATMPAPSDDQCDLATASAGSRLSIAETSELVIPRFARMETAPQIASTLRFGDASSETPLDLYVTSAEPNLVAAGLTVVANLAARDQVPGHVPRDRRRTARGPA